MGLQERRIGHQVVRYLERDARRQNGSVHKWEHALLSAPPPYAASPAAVADSSDFGSGWQQRVATMAVVTAWLSVAWWMFYFVDIDCIGWTGLRETALGRVALQIGILLETATFVGSGLLLGSLPDATSPAYAMLAAAVALKGLAWAGGHVGVHAPETLET